MGDAPSPSIHAHELHAVDDNAARAFVDDVFGSSDEWQPLLIKYRLAAAEQADWKAEVGHWLRTADRLGFLENVLKRALDRAKSPPPEVVRPVLDANDPHHRVLAQELAPAMATHYFVGTGWAFDAWDPITGGGVDVDVSLHAPGGPRVLLQVKAPDQPGYVICHRRVDGEYDDRVLGQIAKGATQLPSSATEATLIVVSANRISSLAANPRCVVVDLIGSSLQEGSGIRIPQANRGKFWRPEWKHVSGVVLLDYLRGQTERGVDEFKYCCTVLPNPTADVQVEAEWFPRARVCVLEGSTFRWVRGAPGISHTLPDGTRLTEG